MLRGWRMRSWHYGWGAQKDPFPTCGQSRKSNTNRPTMSVSESLGRCWRGNSGLDDLFLTRCIVFSAISYIMRRCNRWCQHALQLARCIPSALWTHANFMLRFVTASLHMFTCWLFAIARSLLRGPRRLKVLRLVYCPASTARRCRGKFYWRVQWFCRRGADSIKVLLRRMPRWHDFGTSNYLIKEQVRKSSNIVTFE